MAATSSSSLSPIPASARRLNSRGSYSKSSARLMLRQRSASVAPGLGSLSPASSRMMGGDVTVTSEPGKGSVFTVRLPVGETS